MLNLPLRPSGFLVEVGPNGEAFDLAPLTDAEFMDLVEDDKVMALVDGRAGDVKEMTQAEALQAMPILKLLKLFNTKVQGAEKIQVGAVAFNANDPEHLDSVPRTMKMTAATKLLAYQFTAGDIAGNLSAPDESSPEDTAPETGPDASGDS